jgi:hypothetical protein
MFDVEEVQICCPCPLDGCVVDLRRPRGGVGCAAIDCMFNLLSDEVVEWALGLGFIGQVCGLDWGGFRINCLANMVALEWSLAAGTLQGELYRGLLLLPKCLYQIIKLQTFCVVAQVCLACLAFTLKTALVWS